MAIATKTKHFTFTGVKELRSGAFYADIKYGSKKVGTVENEGRGGCDDIFILDREIEKLFMDRAKAEFPDDVEPEAGLVTRLAMEFDLNKMRGGAIAYVFDLDDFYDRGGFKTAKPAEGVVHADFITAFKKTYPNAFVWSKENQVFIKAIDL